MLPQTINLTDDQRRRSNAWNNVLAVTAHAAKLQGLGHYQQAAATRKLALHLTHAAARYTYMARALRIEREHGDWAKLIG